MVKIFGNFLENIETDEYLIISFSSDRAELGKVWKNNILSADYLAQYWGNFIPAYIPSHKGQQTELQDSIGFIANELLENAFKFNFSNKFSIKISLSIINKSINFHVTNSIDPDIISEFQKTIKLLQTKDPQELLLKQMELVGNDETNQATGLGYLTLLVDYGVELAWKFDTLKEKNDLNVVTTLASMKISRDSFT